MICDLRSVGTCVTLCHILRDITFKKVCASGNNPILLLYRVSQNKISRRENRDISIIQEHFFMQNFPYLFSTYFFTSVFHFTQLT